MLKPRVSQAPSRYLSLSNTYGAHGAGSAILTIIFLRVRLCWLWFQLQMNNMRKCLCRSLFDENKVVLSVQVFRKTILPRSAKARTARVEPSFFLLSCVVRFVALSPGGSWLAFLHVHKKTWDNTFYSLLRSTTTLCPNKRVKPTSLNVSINFTLGHAKSGSFSSKNKS